MITYDDLEPSEKIKVYDKGVSFTDDPAADPGDACRLPHRRHVGAEARTVPRRCASKASISSTASNHAKAPKTDGRLGLRVVELIEAATNSMRGRGEAVYVQRDANDRRQSRAPRRQYDRGQRVAQAN